MNIAVLDYNLMDELFTSIATRVSHESMIFQMPVEMLKDDLWMIDKMLLEC